MVFFFVYRSSKQLTFVKHKIPRPCTNCKACDDEDFLPWFNIVNHKTASHLSMNRIRRLNYWKREGTGKLCICIFFFFTNSTYIRHVPQGLIIILLIPEFTRESTNRYEVQINWSWQMIWMSVWPSFCYFHFLYSAVEIAKFLNRPVRSKNTTLINNWPLSATRVALWYFNATSIQ